MLSSRIKHGVCVFRGAKTLFNRYNVARLWSRRGQKAAGIRDKAIIREISAAACLMVLARCAKSKPPRVECKRARTVLRALDCLHRDNYSLISHLPSAVLTDADALSDHVIVWCAAELYIYVLFASACQFRAHYQCLCTNYIRRIPAIRAFQSSLGRCYYGNERSCGRFAWMLERSFCDSVIHRVVWESIIIEKKVIDWCLVDREGSQDNLEYLFWVKNTEINHARR